MIHVNHFSSTFLPAEIRHTSQISLTLVAYCAGPDSIQRLLEWEAIHKVDWKDIERIACVEPLITDPDVSRIEENSLQLKAMGWGVFVSQVPTDLLALRLNEGICASSGRFIWFVNATTELPSFSPAVMAQTAAASNDNRVHIFVNPREVEDLPNLPGVQLSLIDVLYKGWRFPLGNSLFPRTVFDTYGLFDPHIALKGIFDQEYLLRICRWHKIQLVVQKEGASGLMRHQFPPFLFTWLDIDRVKKLLPEEVSSYALDDLDQFARQISEKIRWEIYLNEILPYYWSHRYFIPRGFLEAPQSLVPPHRHVTVLKTDYETLIDVGLRNYDQFAQGRRFYKLTYHQYHQFEPSRRVEDALLLPRPADPYYGQLIRQMVSEGKPVGFVLDDDLLHFYEIGGGFSTFRPGHSAYDAMSEAIETADVVLCGGDHIQRVTQSLNPRTIHYEGCVLPQFLPSTGTPRNQVFKFGYAGGGYRVREMQMLWPAVQKICKEYTDGVHFEFWGMDSSIFSNIPEQVTFRPFTTNYYAYVDALSKGQFNAMLVPHMMEPSPQRGKLPNKVFEAAVAGTFGIFSDVPTYEVVRRFGIGLMAKEETDHWYSAMKSVLEMEGRDYRQLQQSAIQFVNEFFTAPAMLPVHEAGLHALFFHGATRLYRGENGKPVVMYVFPVISGTGGGEVVFRRRLELAKKAGIQPLVVIPQWQKETSDWPRFRQFLDSLDIPCDFAWFRAFVVTPPKEDILPLEEEEPSVRALFQRYNVALVHSGGYIPVFGKVCSDLGIPHVLTHYGVDDQYWWPLARLPFQQCDLVHSDTVRYARKWGHLFDADWIVARDTCPENFFELGFKKLYLQNSQDEKADKPTRMGVMGTLIPRKCQLEIIQAVILLLEKGANIRLTVYGSLSSDPEYSKKCIQEVKDSHFSDRIKFTDHITDIYSAFKEIEILLTLSSFESLPTTIKEGMPSGCLIVATLAGGIGELCKDNQNAIICPSTEPAQIAKTIQRALNLSPEQSLTIRRKAFSMAIQEFHPRRALADLLLMYNQALALNHRRNRSVIGNSTIEPTTLPQVESSPRGPIVEFPTAPFRRVTDLGGGLSYKITPNHDRWSGIDIKVGTHNGPAGGIMELQIFSDSGNLLRKDCTSLENFPDNDWAKFRFEPIHHSKGLVFEIRLVMVEPIPGMRISIYENASREPLMIRAVRKYGRFVSLKLASRDLHCRINYEPAYQD